MRYTDEELIEKMQQLSARLNKSPSAKDCNEDKTMPNSSTYITRFGGWNKAKEICEVVTYNKFATKSKEELILGLQNFFNLNNRPPVQKECRVANNLAGPNTYKDRFGSWEAALQAAGLGLNKLRSSQETEEYLLESIRKFYLENNRAPRHEDCNSGIYPYLKSHMIYVRRFGTFTDALLLAEVPLNINTKSVSRPENELAIFISSIYDGAIIRGDRTILSSGLELDIVLPDIKLAIELNGIYWHSELHKSNNYHLNKTIEANAAGYRLIHILDYEWLNKNTIVKNRLNHIVKSSAGKKIYARKCVVKEISSIEANKFLDYYHIQGSVNCSIRLGLFYNNVLVAVQTLSKSRFNKGFEYELVRYSSSIPIVGGASKLLSYFKKTFNPISIISYSDIRWNTGDLYINLGFTLSHTSKPNYSYVKGSKIYSRLQFQKHKLEGKLERYDPSLTEVNNMSINGYYRIFDCGNKVYTWVKEDSKCT